MRPVFPIQTDLVPALSSANLPTTAFRVPDHPFAPRLHQATGPLAMPSPNLSTWPSAAFGDRLEADCGEALPILEGGNARCGVESTILREHEGVWEIIRLGSIAPESFTPILGYQPQVTAHSDQSPVCPGQLFRHYAPKARLKPTQHFTDVT